MKGRSWGNSDRLEAYPTLAFRRDEPRPGRKHSVERVHAPSAMTRTEFAKLNPVDGRLLAPDS
jgi:hypothetical protein